MDNAQKAIMIGVGLFITIIIIAAVMLITGWGQDMINESTEQVGNISTSLEKQLTSQFDGTTVTGSAVIAAVKSYYTTEGMIIDVNGTQMGLSVKKETEDYGKVGDSYTVKGLKDNTPIAVGKLSDPNSDTYVPSNAKYSANLIKISDTVVGIKFTKK